MSIMDFIRFDDCDSLIEMAEKCIQNPNKKPSFLDTGTMGIIVDEFPTFMEAANIFWKGDDNRLYSNEEERKAFKAYVNVCRYLNGEQVDGVLVDSMIIIKLTAKMICRANI